VGCLLVIIGWLSPRLVVFCLWLFTDRMTIAFSSGIVAVLGFVIAPYTTMLYALAYHPIAGVTGVGWLVVALGALVDLGSYAGGGQQANSRRSNA
jgi:hypothetical protein